MKPETAIEGWKDIAAHLGVSERTVRRWAAEHGLPVYRRRGSTRVRALPSALAQWDANQQVHVSTQRAG